jgi:hypothetical protein
MLRSVRYSYDISMCSFNSRSRTLSMSPKFCTSFILVVRRNWFCPWKILVMEIVPRSAPRPNGTNMCLPVDFNLNLLCVATF